MSEDKAMEQKKDPIAFWWGCAWTLIYGISFFPLLLHTGLWSFVTLEGGLSFLAVCTVLINLCILLSLPASVYLMWRYHNRSKYDMVYFAWSLPLALLAVLLIIDSLASELKALWNFFPFMVR